jgi:hypothetical protein
MKALPYWLAGSENLLVLLLVGAAMVTYRRMPAALPFTFIVSLLLYVVIIAALIGLSTPNLGTLSRYKVAFMPFLLYLVLQTGIIGLYLRQFTVWFMRRSIFKSR